MFNEFENYKYFHFHNVLPTTQFREKNATMLLQHSKTLHLAQCAVFLFLFVTKQPRKQHWMVPQHRNFQAQQGQFENTASSSNILHSHPTHSPSTHVCIKTGANMRRTIHHSKVPSTSHFLKLFSITDHTCPKSKLYITVCCNLENGPSYRPTFMQS